MIPKAIVKASYTKSVGGAKAFIRYIAHRPAREQERTSRQLWTMDAPLEKTEAYHLIDQAPPGSFFYRLALSPDPLREDGPRDLYLRSVTEATMEEVAERTGKSVAWVATTHADHSPHRHTHVLAVVQGRLTSADLRAVTQRATTACREQRFERDAVREAQRGREEEQQWDWALS